MAKRLTALIIIERMLNEVFTSRKRWTKDAMARNRPHGDVVSVFSQQANCFCLVGGLRKAAGRSVFDKNSPALVEAHRAIAREINEVAGEHGLGMWNDTHYRTFREIKNMLRRVRGKLIRQQTTKTAHTV